MVQKPYPHGERWNDEDIVISGISGRFPNSESVEEFQKNLLDGIDLITDEPRRFQNGLYGAIKRYGLLKDLTHFDAKFFNIHPKQAQRMDPQIRKLLEVAYETTVDAGLHPEDLKGTRTGVVVGVASSETQDKWSQMPYKINGYEYTGCTRTMFANRISHHLDLRGPSYSIDTASSTTLVAFQQAYDLIKDGVCDACFVCGSDLVMNPNVCLMFQCLNMLSPEGKCKAFDISGDGYVRSEGAIAVLLQKAKNAKRVYAKVLAAGSNCDGYKDEGITFPSGPQQVKLFRRVAELAGVNPATVDFVEAHGSATRVGDPQEMNAVTEVFTTGRSGPLRTGSIKSNMGHGEPASALSAVIKICIAMECDTIPPNLHYNIPNPDIPALLDGRLKVITEPTPWNGGLVAVNSFGVGGANGHAILHSNKKIKKINSDTIPRLICVSGVTENAVKYMLNKITTLPANSELYALLNNIHRKNIKGHNYKGCAILDHPGFNIQNVSSKPEKLCVIFHGFETKWDSVKENLCNIESFLKSVNTSARILKTFSKTLNLKQILQTMSTEQSSLNLTVGIVALQIAIVDVLRSIGLQIDCVIGYNIGEIASGYALKCYTLEESILLAFNIGTVLPNQLNSASCAEVEISSKTDNIEFPHQLNIVAHTSSTKTLVCGPKSEIHKFIAMLNDRQINATEVESSGVDNAGLIQSHQKNKIKQVPQVRVEHYSKNWLSLRTKNLELNDNYANLVDIILAATSVQEALFSVCCPLLEIGRHTEYECSHDVITMFEKDLDALNFVSTVGRLYNLGYQPQIQNLYPEVEFPVSHRTPMIQSMIEWDHSEAWNVVSFAPKEGKPTGEFEITVDFDKEEFSYLQENYVNGVHVCLKSFYIILIQIAMGKLMVKSGADISLLIEHINFLRETVISHTPKKFMINLLGETGKFEIWESGEIVVTGHVKKLEEANQYEISDSLFNINNTNQKNCVFKDDIYRDLTAKHYQYNDKFMELESYDYSGNSSQVNDNRHFCALLEAFFQMMMFDSKVLENSYPSISGVRKIILNSNNSVINDAIKFNKTIGVFKSQSVQMEGIETNQQYCHPKVKPTLEYYNFIPFVSSNIDNAFEISLRLALQNLQECNDLKIVELITNSEIFSIKLMQINPFISVNNITFLTNDIELANEEVEQLKANILYKDLSSDTLDKYHILLAPQIMLNENAVNNLINSLYDRGCLLLTNPDEMLTSDSRLTLISSLSNGIVTYEVFKKVNLERTPRIINITDTIDCQKGIKQAIDGSETDIVIYGKNLQTAGAINACRLIPKQDKNKNISLVFVDDDSAPQFSLDNPFYKNQLTKLCPINVYQHGQWGTYVYQTMDDIVKSPITDVFLGYDVNYNDVKFVKANQYIRRSIKESLKCTVHCVGLNSKDFQIYSGSRFSSHSMAHNHDMSLMGNEYSGYSGKNRVFGLVPGGAASTVIEIQPHMVWNVPPSWSLEEAVTVPLAYAYAYYSLCIRANLIENETVLIIGANSVALAAVSIVLQHTSNVIILLSNVYHKLMFQKLFPQINESRIIVVQNENFYLNILKETNVVGVQTVFNTSSKRETYSFKTIIQALSENGKYVYFEDDAHEEEILGSAGNMRCITFHRITPSSIYETDIAKRIHQLIQDGINNGIVKPLLQNTFRVHEFKEAFKNMGNELCKPVIVFKDQELDDQNCSNILSVPRTYLDGDKSFIVLGGLHGYGLFVTNWLVQQGAKHLLLLHFHEQNDKALQNIYMHQWIEQNVKIVVKDINSLDRSECESFISTATEIAPLDGIFDFTNFKDFGSEKSIFKEQESRIPEDFSPKLKFIEQMDLVTRTKCPDLKYFVCFTNMEIEQDNMGSICFQNGIIQKLMFNRYESDFPAKLIQWGPIGAPSSEAEYETTSTNLQLQTVTSGFRTLHILLETQNPVVCSYVLSERTNAVEESKAEAMVEGVAKFLGIKDPNSISPNLSMLDLGLDSLIGTDIQQFLEVNYGIILSTQEVRELTFASLRSIAEEY